MKVVVTVTDTTYAIVTSSETPTTLSSSLTGTASAHTSSGLISTPAASTLLSSVSSLSSTVPIPNSRPSDATTKPPNNPIFPAVVTLAVALITLLFVFALVYLCIQKRKGRCPHCADMEAKNRRLEEALCRTADPITTKAIRYRESSLSAVDEKRRCDEEAGTAITNQRVDSLYAPPEADPKAKLELYQGYIPDRGSLRLHDTNSTMSRQYRNLTVEANRRATLDALEGRVDIGKQAQESDWQKNSGQIFGMTLANAGKTKYRRPKDAMRAKWPGKSQAKQPPPPIGMHRTPSPPAIQDPITPWPGKRPYMEEAPDAFQNSYGQLAGNPFLKDVSYVARQPHVEDESSTSKNPYDEYTEVDLTDVPFVRPTPSMVGADGAADTFSQYY